MINTSQAVADFAGRITPEIAMMISLKYAEVAPLYNAVLSLGGSAEAKQSMIHWETDSLVEIHTTINNGPDNYNAATTSIVVSDASVFGASDILYVPATGERMIVTASNTATNTLTVRRGIHGSTAATGSVSDTSLLRNIGNASGEGSGAPNAKMTSTARQTTYTQHFKAVVERTGRAARSETLTEDETSRLRIKRFTELMRDVNQACMFGVPGTTTTDANGKPVSTMGGLFNASSVNTTAIDGAMSKAAFDEAVRPVLTVSGGRAQLIGGAAVINAVHTMSENKLQTTASDTSFGIAVSEIRTPFGVVELIPDHVSLTGVHSGDCVVAPLAGMRIRALKRNDGGGLMLPYLKEIGRASCRERV